jgi:hypothetical protein
MSARLFRAARQAVPRSRSWGHSAIRESLPHTPDSRERRVDLACDQRVDEVVQICLRRRSSTTLADHAVVRRRTCRVLEDLAITVPALQGRLGGQGGSPLDTVRRDIPTDDGVAC